MTQCRVRLRTCGSCPEGRNLIVYGRAETFCKKQKFRRQDDRCNLGLLDDSESHEESTLPVDDNRIGEQKESYHWSRGRFPSYYLDGEPYVPKDPRTRPCWSLEENEMFVRLYNEGYTSRQIAERMNKSIYSIAAKTRHYLKAQRKGSK